MSDSVNHPSHYHSEYWHSKCGKTVECIDIVRHMDFNLGNAVKYIWRAGKKGDKLEDLRKANWYIADAICELEREREEAAKDELVEQDRAKLLETLHAAEPEPEVPVVHGVEVDSNSVSGRGLGECWVFYVYDKWTADNAWSKFNQEEFFINHPMRVSIRDALLTLISRLPTSAYDGLAAHVREAVVDWQWATGTRGDC